MSIEVCNGFKNTEPLTLVIPPHAPVVPSGDKIPIETSETDIEIISNIQELVDSSKINLNGKITI